MKIVQRRTLGRRLAMGAGGFAFVLLVSPPLAAQPEPEPDPCAHAYGQSDLNACWARELHRAESDMDRTYRALLEKLPKRAAGNLEKAQKLWREFVEAHVGTLYGVESPRAKWGREYLMCLSITRSTLYRQRTRQLERILEPDELTVCPL